MNIYPYRNARLYNFDIIEKLAIQIEIFRILEKLHKLYPKSVNISAVEKNNIIRLKLAECEKMVK